MKILVIPDTQVKPHVPLMHLEACGNYIVEKRPDAIVHLGDHWDMQSLSSYDKGKKASEGRRVQEDIEAGVRGMEALLSPLWALQKRQRKNKKRVYEPRRVFCLGNHEERIMRHVNANAEMEGFLSYDDLKLKEMGWEVYDFREPVTIEGFTFAHYFYNPNSGRPYGGQIQNKINKIKTSFVQGHCQGLEVGTETTNSGKVIWGFVAGSFYMHEEEYKGYQGNGHWHGVLMLNEVQDGNCSPNIVSLDFLLRKYL